MSAKTTEKQTLNIFKKIFIQYWNGGGGKKDKELMESGVALLSLGYMLISL